MDRVGHPSGSCAMHNFKQNAEFTIVQGGQRLAGLLVFLTDVHGLGLQAARGATLTTELYWDLTIRRECFATLDGGKSASVATNALPIMAEDHGSDRTRDQAHRVDSEHLQNADERIGFLARRRGRSPCCKAGNRTIRP